jgi:hypothetical protein
MLTWLLAIALVAFIVLCIVQSIRSGCRWNEENEYDNPGEQIVSLELDQKKTEYTFAIPGFIKTLGLDAWYCSIENIHHRCPSILFMVNAAKYKKSGKPVFSARKIKILCLEGSQSSVRLNSDTSIVVTKPFDLLRSHYIGSFNSRHYLLVEQEELEENTGSLEGYNVSVL